MTLEATLPGLSSWGRVRDYREARLREIPNVSLYLESRLDADHIFEFGCAHVVLATGSSWRADGMGRAIKQPVPGVDEANVFTPDDLLRPEWSDDRLPAGNIVIFDDDHYYMGGVLAERLSKAGHTVTLVTPGSEVSAWTDNTLEQARIQTRLLECGVRIVQQRTLKSVAATSIETACVYTGAIETMECATLVLVTARLPERDLYDALMARSDDWSSAGITDVTLIGDALAPGTIAAAVYDGHRFAREFDAPPDRDRAPFRREMPWWGAAHPHWANT